MYVYIQYSLKVRQTCRSSGTYNTAIDAKCAAPPLAGLYFQRETLNTPKILTYSVRRLFSPAKLISQICSICRQLARANVQARSTWKRTSRLR